MDELKVIEILKNELGFLDISIKIWFSPLNPLACIQLEIATSCFIG